MDKNFVKVSSEMFVRQGAKAPWIEVVTVKDGKESKWIMKKVEEFISERAGTIIEL